jgi:hypothetical protein
MTQIREDLPTTMPIVGVGQTTICIGFLRLRQRRSIWEGTETYGFGEKCPREKPTSDNRSCRSEYSCSTKIRPSEVVHFRLRRPRPRSIAGGCLSSAGLLPFPLANLLPSLATVEPQLLLIQLWSHRCDEERLEVPLPLTQSSCCALLCQEAIKWQGSYGESLDSSSAQLKITTSKTPKVSDHCPKVRATHFGENGPRGEV